MKNPTVVFVGPENVVIEDRELPSPGHGQLLVKTICSLISIGTELTLLSGKTPEGSVWYNYSKYPIVPGYDNVGIVVDVGEGVSKELIGRRVSSYGHHSAFVVISADHARYIPNAVSDDEASFCTIAEITMNGVRRGNVTWGESVVIYGLGLLGQFTARFCNIAGARPIICVDTSDRRISLLPELPNIIGVNALTSDVRDVVYEKTRGRLANVVFEVTGDPELIPKEFAVLARQGRFVILSSPRGRTPMFDFHDLCNSPSYVIIGAHNSSHPPVATPQNPWTQHRHAELFFDLLSERAIDVSKLISHKVSYTQAPETYKQLLKDRTQFMGVIISWSGAS